MTVTSNSNHVPQLSVEGERSPDQAQADALVLLASRDGGAARLLPTPGLSDAAREHIEQALASVRFTCKPDGVVVVLGTPDVAAGQVAVTGVGPLEAGRAPTAEAVRRAAGAAVRALPGRDSVAVAVPEGEGLAVAAADGAALGGYRFLQHLSVKAREKALESGAPVSTVTLLVPGASDEVVEGVRRAQVLAAAQVWARDLVNTAPNKLFPESFAAAVAERVGKNLTVEVLDETTLAEGGFGGIIGVGQGSVNPPRLVVLSYAPTTSTGHLAFVGKGITFDSGGLCIKPGDSMVTMKCDMGGAAAVAGALVAIAELELPVAVTGYLCLAENMPGGDAQRPGDVVTMRDGQTVEIINTDAEGRMVLADGIALAAESGPDAIVDIATLTGAATVALGERTAAIMANDDDLQGELTSAATAVGESVWPMPITEEIRAGLDSTVADVKHMGERAGGAMSAAAFLREFPGEGAEGRARAWGHIDIAGPAFNDKAAYGYTPKGGTGFGVRTLVAFAEGRG